MIKAYFTLKVIIPIITISTLILVALLLYIKSVLDSKLKQNCFKCKYYKLYDVSSIGGDCRYKCTLKNKCNNNKINDNCNFVNCKDFLAK